MMNFVSLVIFALSIGLCHCSEVNGFSSTQRIYHWPKDWESDVEFESCYFESEEVAKECVNSFDISFDFPDYRQCLISGSNYCSAAMNAYSQFLSSPDMTFSQLENIVQTGYCSNNCLLKYIRDEITRPEEQQQFLDFMVILGRMIQDMNSIGDSLIQSSGVRQKFAGFKNETQQFSFPGFGSFVAGFKNILQTVEGAVNLISQVTKETEKYLDKIVELASTNLSENDKVGPIGMYNLEAAGRLLQNVVRSNTLLHKSINTGYFNHFLSNHTMPIRFLPLCMDEITFSEKLYSVGFEYYCNLDAPPVKPHDISQYFQIRNSGNRFSTRMLLKRGNTTVCDSLLPPSDPE